MPLIIKISMIFVVLAAFFNCSILTSKAEDIMEQSLRKKIDGVYKAYKERNFEQLLGYSSNYIDEKEKREKRIAEMEKTFPILIDYKIKDIKITNKKAKVKVVITVILNNTKDIFENVDYWEFKNNDWLLFDFGKIE
jgi:lipopolysaccharide export LptBFGC system permease protein LptF